MTLVEALQPSFDDLSTPLIDVTFAVLDLETTGLSPTDDRITEVGVVKCRGGELLGEFSTLVHPQRSIPIQIVTVTGITDQMVASRPPIEAVLPTLVEFLRGCVLVAHNASFDTRFLAATLQRHSYPPLALPVVDTAAVARRILRDEVRNCRLSTLARHVRSPTVPEHRALPDARATRDVLHYLLERAGTLGATTLEELQHYARSSSDAAYRKISLVADAPSEPGVYRFLDRAGEVLYVGTSRDLRSRLRTYFGGDRRRRIADMVRETERVERTVTPTPLEAGVLELRLIHAHRPRYNRRSRMPERQVHLRLTRERFPRLSLVREVRGPDAISIGPVGTRRTAAHLVEAIEDVVAIRRCTTRLRSAQDHATCVLKDLGRCGSPCDGTQSAGEYGEIVDRVASWLRSDPTELLGALRQRMDGYAEEHRYEEATRARVRLHAVARAIQRDRRRTWVRTPDELAAVRSHADRREAILLRSGLLVASCLAEPTASDEEVLERLRAATPTPRRPPAPDQASAPPALDGAMAEEIDLVINWLREPGVRLLHLSGRAPSELVAGGQALHDAELESGQVARSLRRDRRAGGSAPTRTPTPVPSRAAAQPAAAASS